MADQPAPKGPLSEPYRPTSITPPKPEKPKPKPK
jgi:hypothetical protein